MGKQTVAKQFFVVLVRIIVHVMKLKEFVVCSICCKCWNSNLFTIHNNAKFKYVLKFQYTYLEIIFQSFTHIIWLIFFFTTFSQIC